MCSMSDGMSLDADAAGPSTHDHMHQQHRQRQHDFELHMHRPFSPTTLHCVPGDLPTAAAAVALLAQQHQQQQHMHQHHQQQQHGHEQVQLHMHHHLTGPARISTAIKAVKFGRMSKKQREKVEDEVRLHKHMGDTGGGMQPMVVRQFASNNGQYNGAYVPPSYPYMCNGSNLVTSTSLNASYASSSGGPSPSSSDPYLSAGVPTTSAHPHHDHVQLHEPPTHPVGTVPAQYNGTGDIDALTPHTVMGGLDGPPIGHTVHTLEPVKGEILTEFKTEPLTDLSPVSNIEMLTKTVAGASAHTALYSPQRWQEIQLAGIDHTFEYRVNAMTRTQCWLMCAEELTNVIKTIIEFAKLIPGFMNLQQDDQIMLLKRGSFEVALVRAASYYSSTLDSIALSGGLVSLYTLSDMCTDRTKHCEPTNECNAEVTDMWAADRRAILHCCSAVRQVASSGLTETGLSLLAALLLICPNRAGVRDTTAILDLRQQLVACLQVELGGCSDTLQSILAICPNLASAADAHLQALARFRLEQPNVELPALYRELFVIDA